ncbi:MAG: phospholipase D-like domain-containing protein [Sphaerochaetaceae bacterium]
MKKVFILLLVLSILYVLIGAVGVFYIHRPQESSYRSDHRPSRFYSESIGVDKALIIEDRILSAVTRINLIEGAQKSIDLAYYAVHNGVVSDTFYATVFEAAQRGVKVRLLFDGMFHNLKGLQLSTYEALISHPNIEIKLYEPLNLLKPWTLQNRLHDKFLIVDDVYVLIGGRNIGDKYYLEHYDKPVVEDRDVFILNSDSSKYPQSVLSQFHSYYELLWNHPYSHIKKSRLSHHKGIEAQQRLVAQLHKTKEEFPQRFKDPIDWEEYALPTNNITLITNPIARFNKEPHILMELDAIASQSDESIYLQSPYIIPTKRMLSYFSDLQGSPNLHYITNSARTSPNPFALSGYMKYRNKISKNSASLSEYQGLGSIHAKTYLFDKRLSVVGSFNLDARSSFLSTESMVVIDSVPIAKELITHMNNLTYNSYHHDSEKNTISWTKRVLLRIIQLLLYPFNHFL